MNSTVEALEENKVKVTVTVDETEFETEIDAAFRRIAKEVNLPGFRPGKAPRKLLEARIGIAVAREEAMREALPRYYSQAIAANDVDVIASPDIDITGGEEEGPVTFDAVVEVRPVVTVAGYDGLKVTMAPPEPSDDEIDAQIDRMRQVDATHESVDRPAQDGDTVVINIVGTLDGEEQDGLSTDEYNYEVGSGVITPEVDEHLAGASAGDSLSFDATHPDEDEERQLHFEIEVTDVKAKVLPDLTDEWAAENSDFDTLAAFKADMVERMTNVRRAQGEHELTEKVAEALAKLVTDDVPESLVNNEMSNRLQDLTMRLQAQGMNFEQYLMMTGRSQEDLVEEMKANAETSARVDLALRAVAEAENIECDDEDVEAEAREVAVRVDETVEQVLAQLESNDQLSAVRSDIKKRKALEWLIDRVEIVDLDGNPIDRSVFSHTDDDTDPDDSETEESE